MNSDGLYQVTTKYLCAGYEIQNGKVIYIAPILQKKFSYWQTIAKKVEENQMGGSEILAQKRAERDSEKQARREYEDYILESYGPDDADDGDIIVWFKQFNEGGTLYSYAALRARGLWYITGKEQRLNWVDLMAEIERENAGPIRIYKVSEIEEFIVEDTEEDGE